MELRMNRKRGKLNTFHKSYSIKNDLGIYQYIYYMYMPVLLGLNMLKLYKDEDMYTCILTQYIDRQNLLSGS